ncbi:MAG: helix-turn-helix domain-containing protein [Aquihabitans sp.]
MNDEMAPQSLDLPAPTVAELRTALPEVSRRTVDAITTEVAEYRGGMGTTRATPIGSAVEFALASFLHMVADETRTEAAAPPGPMLEAAYELGRGEAASGRTMEALLAAYRVGARVAWEDLAAILVRRLAPAAMVARFAEIVFTYIDELSSASVAGHRDELASSGRVREQRRERLAQALLADEPVEQIVVHADLADWPLPETVTVVVLRTAHVGNLLRLVGPNTLRLAGDVVAGLPSGGLTVLLVADAHRSRSALHAALAGRGAVIGPTRPVGDTRVSYLRVLRVMKLVAIGGEAAIDTEDHLVDLVLNADVESLHDLRVRVLKPLADVRAATAERLVETLRSWLLHQGRRGDVAAHLNIHPQTVRYRMNQLRDLFGDRLTEPDAVLELLVAVAIPNEDDEP